MCLDSGPRCSSMSEDRKEERGLSPRAGVHNAHETDT